MDFATDCIAGSFTKTGSKSMQAIMFGQSAVGRLTARLTFTQSGCQSTGTDSHIQVLSSVATSLAHLFRVNQQNAALKARRLRVSGLVKMLCFELLDGRLVVTEVDQ